MPCLLWYVLEPMSALRSRQKRRGGSTDWCPVWYEKVSNDQNQSRGHDRTWRSCFHRFIAYCWCVWRAGSGGGLFEVPAMKLASSGLGIPRPPKAKKDKL